MTRDEAIATYMQECTRADRDEHWFVDCLAALGILDLESDMCRVQDEAAHRLSGLCIVLERGATGTNFPAYVTKAAAYEIVNTLTKSGFRITRDAK